VSGGWSGGGSRRWRKVRNAVLLANRLANDGLCQVGVRTVCTGVAATAHHVLGRARTGDDPAHLVASCTACNLHIGDPARHNPACKLCAHLTIGRRPADPPPRPMTRW
jgi:hypothetical protein